ncbi:hypothetical protein [Rhodococcus qingshengii]|uniref:hypothetical protein n=1 Tax=Rhodococcus qingshengii TaxID=334542 RepID=UPI001A4F8D4E|nr:hypothetical protein [Rhodococcus qingshengii]ULD38853.1 hypothetical protein JKI97_00695 [Rhodococcus qingshengii]
MARSLKVYGWRGFRDGTQSREVIAAESIADVLRRAGITRADWKWSGGETRNPEEVAIATANPGTVFWHPLDEHPTDRAWREDSATT